MSPALKTLHLAEALNPDCEAHGGGTGNLALVGASSASRWFERGLLHPHTGYDRIPPHLTSLPDPTDEDGYVTLPRAPGLGDDLDLGYIRAHATARRGR